MKVCIVGGVAGGASAAARLRRLSESAEIIIFERTGYVSYANCGLPYYIGGVITDEEELTLQTPESFRARFNIEVRVKSEVTSVHPHDKTITVCNLKNKTTYTESYDALILATGARPALPPFSVPDDPRISTLRTVEDMQAISRYIRDAKPHSAGIVGGGFIAMEMAENLMRAGVSPTLLIRGDQVMPQLDADMAAPIPAYLRQNGVGVRFHEPVAGLELRNGRVAVLRDGKEPLDFDMVVLATGVVPDTHLAEEAGLALGMKGAVVVNEYLQTSDSSIYAVGDAVQIKNLITNAPALIPLAGPANRQGRVAADNILGGKRVYAGAMGSSICRIFDLTVASAGLTEKTARAAGSICDKVILHPFSHAVYYPGAEDMTIKALFSPMDGRILGVQMFGVSGVDKRIDVFAAAIYAGMTAEDLQDLDLCYAPPYSSAKDPVNMTGYVIENVRSGLVVQYHPKDVARLEKDTGVIFLDVRTPQEFAAGHIAGAVNIPIDELRYRMHELDPSRRLYVNCQTGLRSYLACRMLSGNGYSCCHLAGGWQFYRYTLSEV